MKIEIQKLRNLADDNCILIYQMGKVGSSALEKAIKNSIHMHTLYMNGPCDISDKYIYGSPIGKIQLFARDTLKRIMIRRRKQIRIIVPIREPVARNISMFFQGLSFWMCDYIKHFDRETRHANIDWLCQVYEKSFNHEYCETWFQKEIQRFTGINVFDHEFDHEKGLQIIHKGKYSLLLVKSEKMESNIQEIERFTNQEIALQRINSSEAKWYSGAYVDFKQSLDMNLPVIKKIQHGLIARHFGYFK